MKKSTLFSLLTILVLIPVTLYLGIHMTGKAYYLTSTLVVIEILIPFFPVTLRQACSKLIFEIAHSAYPDPSPPLLFAKTLRRKYSPRGLHCFQNLVCVK